MLFQRNWFAAVALLAFSHALYGVDETPIGERMSVVGVISESTTKGTEGIAVLKDRRGGRTFAVKTGETVPGEPSFEVTSVKRNAVVVSNGSRQYTLTYFDDFGSAPAKAQPLAIKDKEATSDEGSTSPAPGKIVVSEPTTEAESGKFYWVGSDDVERKKAQERLEASGIAAGWESVPSSEAGFTVTVNNGFDDSTGFEPVDDSGDDSGNDAVNDSLSEWYDTNDTAAEIIDRLNGMVEAAPRYEAFDGGAVPPPPAPID